MSDPMPSEGADESPQGAAGKEASRQLDELAEQFLDLLQAGQRPDRQAWLASHPEIAAQLDQRLALIERLFQASRPLKPSAAEVPERAIHLKCPHCGNRIQLLEPEPREVTCENCGSSFQLDVEATTTYQPDRLPKTIGKFQVLEQIGRGAFGCVYKARDPELNRVVAIKVPRAGYFGTQEEEERFLREARNAAQLRHPNIVQVYEIAHDRGVPYIVSEYIEGLTLSDQLTGARPSFRESALLLAQIADAVDYAHSQKVVHRDLKPSNILLQRSEMRDERSGMKDEGTGTIAGSGPSSIISHPSSFIPFLTDFGLARRDEGEITVTLEGQILGTPAYMSPEQAAGAQHKVDARSDTYSLGVVLYELLTGELPFRGNKRMLIYQVLHDEPRPPRRLNDRIPLDLETICLKAIAKSPARRYATARELAEDLRRFLNGEPIHARPVSTWERAWRWAKRRPAIAGMMATIALLALIGSSAVTYLWLRAESALETSETNLYLNSINLADQYRLQHNTHRANLLLDRCPADLRHWEWHYLKRVCDSAVLTVRCKGSVARGALSPDDKHVAIAYGDTRKPVQMWLEIWDIESHTRVRDLKLGLGPSWVVFSPDGKSLAFVESEGSTILIYDATSGKAIHRLRGHSKPVRALAYSGDGRHLVSASNEDMLKMWDTASGQELLSAPYNGWPTVLAFRPDGKYFAAGGWDRQDHSGLLQILSAPTGQEICQYKLVSEFVSGGSSETGNAILDLAFSPNGHQLAVACQRRPTDTTETQHDINDPDWEGVDIIECASVHAVAFSPDGKRLAKASYTEGEHEVSLWDVELDVKLHPLYGLRGDFADPIHSLTFNRDGTRLTAAAGRSVVVWDTCMAHRSSILFTSGEDARVHLDGKYWTLSFSSDGSHLAAARDRYVEVWGLPLDRRRFLLRGHASRVNDLAFSPDGKRLASASHDKTVKVWDISTGQEIVTFRGHTGAVWDAAFSPDGGLIASTGDNEILVWDAATAQQTNVCSGCIQP
ncbi:MAG: protein kinase [Planctomycetes bacterium]|nr:protein kinase [Planctomycetota bacterium]